MIRAQTKALLRASRRSRVSRLSGAAWDAGSQKPCREDKGLMEFLRSL
jgi:hypothetical protein